MTILDPPTKLHPLPMQPVDTPWPTVEWPTGPVPDAVGSSVLDALLDRAFGTEPDPGFGESYATVVIHRGLLIAERYGPETNTTTPLLSWSMAKSITHALVGILTGQGLLDPHAAAEVPEWSDPTDARSAITLHHLLRMVDGLGFNETYTIPDDPDADVEWSHCIDMLFGAGSDSPAAYAAAQPPKYAPNTVFNYSSGTANVVARIVCDVIGRGDTATASMAEHLFDPIGMSSATPTYDASGNFIGSSFFHATARDWARFGLLYLRGGLWDGNQIVPRAWVDDGRTTRASNDEGRFYGAHWWTSEDNRGSFYASGHEFQRVICVPTSDLVVVRLGKTPVEDYSTPRTWLEELIALFDEPG